MSSPSTGSGEIWEIIKQTEKNIASLFVAQKELQASQKEFQASQREAKREMKELRVAQKETNKQLKETDKLVKETALQVKKTDARFNTQWGKLVESLVEGKLVEILNERGIEVLQTSQRTTASYRKEDGQIQNKEFDILAVNGTEIVVVEVKTTLRPSDVNYFLKAVRNFKKYCSQYKSHIVYGAVAYLKSESEAHLFAERQGLFVIRATGDSANIINRESFKPKAFS